MPCRAPGRRESIAGLQKQCFLGRHSLILLAFPGLILWPRAYRRLYAVSRRANRTTVTTTSSPDLRRSSTKTAPTSGL